jgi:hypothetical protein
MIKSSGERLNDDDEAVEAVAVEGTMLFRTPLVSI